MGHPAVMKMCGRKGSIVSVVRVSCNCRRDCVWNVMAHAQKPDFVFRRKGRFHLNRRGRQFSRLLAGELCTSACRFCTVRASLCSAVMWHLLVNSILLFPLHFSARASPCAVTFQVDSTTFTYRRVFTNFSYGRSETANNGQFRNTCWLTEHVLCYGGPRNVCN